MVDAAEALLAGLFLHVYLSKPWLFHGYLQPYWPFIVLCIAYAGIGLGEWFRRRKLRVLAEPLEHVLEQVWALGHQVSGRISA
ncbi:MAG: hypothetical protein IH991_20970 [Planctomycetes bacterium]|nr:hypothetical protein [Planctomycetota bacterium]